MPGFSIGQHPRSEDEDLPPSVLGSATVTLMVQLSQHTSSSPRILYQVLRRRFSKNWTVIWPRPLPDEPAPDEGMFPPPPPPRIQHRTTPVPNSPLRPSSTGSPLQSRCHHILQPPIPPISRRHHHRVRRYTLPMITFTTQGPLPSRSPRACSRMARVLCCRTSGSLSSVRTCSIMLINTSSRPLGSHRR